VLTGINLGNYANGTLDLVGLIKRLKTETDIYRIRLSSIEPNHVSDELIEYLATSGVLCEHLHIPLQSGSDQVLHAMNRRYTTDDYANLVAKIRAAVPNCALTTDLIVGFPTETDVAFKDTLAFCGDQHFAKAHVFRFSARAGTPAAAFPPLDPPTVAARAQQLRDLTALDALAFKQRFNDTDLEVIVEHVDDQAKRATGTSREYLRFSFAADRYVPGDVARVCYHG
jgi:threonylcarbamoyladenosine tRNA methylthiotransferase MtaB